MLASADAATRWFGDRLQSLSSSYSEDLRHGQIPSAGRPVKPVGPRGDSLYGSSKILSCRRIAGTRGISNLFAE
jgi:hypothetical protein